MTATEKKEWISIFDKEPKHGQGVLIALDNGVITIGYRTIATGNPGYSSRYSWQLFGEMNSLAITDDNYVTHWMPLPAHPNTITP